MKKLLVVALASLALMPAIANAQSFRVEIVDCESSAVSRPFYTPEARSITTSFSLLCRDVKPGTRITVHVHYLGLYKRHPRGGPWIAHKKGQATKGQVPAKILGKIAIKTVVMSRTVKAAPRDWYWQGQAKVTVIGRYKGQTSKFTTVLVSPIVEHPAR